MDLYLAIFYMNPVYSTRLRPHTGFYYAAFQSRSCSPCTGYQKVFISNNQLSVGPDIQEDRNLLLFVYLRFYYTA